MLVRFRFSPSFNDPVIRNYQRVLERLLTSTYHIRCALIESQQYELICLFSFPVMSDTALGPLIDTMLPSPVFKRCRVRWVDFACSERESQRKPLFYIRSFWEAPENVSNRFLDLVPDDYKFDYAHI